MSSRPQRSKKPNGWLVLDSSNPVPGSSDAVYTDQTATGSDQDGLDARPVLPSRKRGRPRNRAAAAAQPAAKTINDLKTPADECGLDALLGAIGNDADALSELEDNDLRMDRWYVEAFKAYKALDGFENERPVPLREQLSMINDRVTQVLQMHQQQRGFSSSLARVNLLHNEVPGSFGAQWAPATDKELGLSDNEDDEAGGQQEQATEVQQEQQQQHTQQHDTAGDPTVFYTPGGGRHAAEDLLGKHTPNGFHLAGGWQPDQQQPFGQLSAQQRYRQPVEQQQHRAEYHRGQQQQQQSTVDSGLSRTLEVLRRQIERQGARAEAMSPGPQLIELEAQIREDVKQLLKLQQDQNLQSGHQPASWGPAAAAANISRTMGQDPIDAFMEPGINSNPAFRAALGARLSASTTSSCNAAAGIIGYWTHVLHEKLEEMLPRVLQQAVQQGHSAPVTEGAVTEPGSAATKAAPNSATATANESRGTLSQQAAKGQPSVPREVPFLRSQKSLPDMIKWYTQERDISVEEAGQVTMCTRSELRDQGRSWASREFSRRAAEYDVIYDRLKAMIVQLTKETDQPKTMDDAVQHVLQTAKVCQPGGITLYKYMEQCRVWRKSQVQAAKAAAAAAAATAEHEDEGDEQEEGVASEQDS